MTHLTIIKVALVIIDFFLPLFQKRTDLWYQAQRNNESDKTIDITIEKNSLSMNVHSDLMNVQSHPVHYQVMIAQVLGYSSGTNSLYSSFSVLTFSIAHY